MLSSAIAVEVAGARCSISSLIVISSLPFLPFASLLQYSLLVSSTVNQRMMFGFAAAPDVESRKVW
jgi:hypothetical protein